MFSRWLPALPFSNARSFQLATLFSFTRLAPLLNGDRSQPSAVDDRTMQEIPIAIEENGSELFAEWTADALNEALDNHVEDLAMPIAVVGMGFRGPGDATDVHKLWKMILEQREGWKPIPEERWNNKAFYHPDHTRHGTVRTSGLTSTSTYLLTGL